MLCGTLLACTGTPREMLKLQMDVVTSWVTEAERQRSKGKEAKEGGGIPGR